MVAITISQLVAVAWFFSVAQCSVQVELDGSSNALGCNIQNYAALGDSYSAGLYSQPHGELPICGKVPTPDCTTRTCARNMGAYGYVLANEMPQVPKFEFLACSGADTFSCNSTQVPLVSNTSDLVTFTIGGNNNNSFANVVKWCVYEHVFGNCSAALYNATQSLQTLDGPVIDLYKSIKVQAPKAKIVHLGYVQFWPGPNVIEPCESVWLEKPNATEKATMNSLVTKMNAKLAVLAAATNITFIDVNPLFEGHRLCDVGGADNTWIRWALFEKDKSEWNYENGVFHPTYLGQDAYLAALKLNLGCATSNDVYVESEEVKHELRKV